MANQEFDLAGANFSEGKLLVADGRFEAAKAGRQVQASSATGGIAIIAAAAGGGHPTLWNPLGSGRIIEVLSLSVAYVSGNNAPGSLAWNFVKDTGATAATGASSRILTATKVAVESAMIGGVVDSKLYFAPTVNTFTAAPAYGRPISMSLFTGIAGTAVAPWQLQEKYDINKLLIAPGNAICLVNVASTTTSLLRYTVMVQEHDE